MINVICEHCKKVLVLYPSQAKRRRFCSVSCKNEHSRKCDRKCCRCHEVKSLAEFATTGKAKDTGYMQAWSYICKECQGSRSRAYKRTSQGRYVFSVHRAKVRGLDWQISEEDYFRFASSSCYYCGESVGEVGVGLDRKNVDMGYMVSNVVPCCGKCNRLRSDILTFEEMDMFGRELIQKIKAFRKTDCWN